MVLRRATGWAKDLVGALRRLELRVLLTLLLVIGGVWGFLALADELSEEDLGGLDRTVTAWFRDPASATPRGPAWIASGVRDLTALGSGTVLVGLVVVVTVGLFAAGRRTQALFVLVAAVTGFAAAAGLKHAFGRTRPESVAALEPVFSSSFPSGHAFNSAVVYLTLGTLLSRFTKRWPVRVFVLAVSLALTAVIGLSRIYLGYHYPSDVLAGWAGGLAWALLCALAAEWLGHRLQGRGKAATLDPPHTA